METTTLARPYARAAFEVAHDTDSLEVWSQSLAFAAAVAADPRVAQLGNDPRVLPAQLIALHLPRGVDADAPFAQFLAEMAEQRRLALLPEVASLYESFKRDSQSQLLVKITSALALDDTQAERLKVSLKRRFKREIELEVRVDAALLAGAVIDTGREVIDGSARGRLQRLASELTN
ncbi:MAG: F0F1 ATP synthase subunit delta [Rhodanobacter sp.]